MSDEVCYVCQGRNGHLKWRYFLPMFEGRVVNPDTHEWAGFPVCETCYNEHERKLRMQEIAAIRVSK